MLISSSVHIVLISTVLLLLPSFGFAKAKKPAKAAAEAPVWVVDQGLEAPESAYVAPEDGVIYVSNVSGDAGNKDGKGFISKVSADGKVIAAQWVSGLHAPKGLRSSGGVLWVSNIDELVSIDMASGQIKSRTAIPEAKFLNDVAIGADGTVFVSDTVGGKIYAVKDGAVSTFAEGDATESPNGLLVQGDRLLVAAWGVGIKSDFSTKQLGRLLAYSLSDKKLTKITKQPLGHLDGLESDSRNGYYVSDWMAGRVFHVSVSGKARLMREGFKGAADIGLDLKNKLLLVPAMDENKLYAFKVK